MDLIVAALAVGMLIVFGQLVSLRKQCKRLKANVGCHYQQINSTNETVSGVIRRCGSIEDQQQQIDVSHGNLTKWHVDFKTQHNALIRANDAVVQDQIRMKARLDNLTEKVNGRPKKKRR